MRKLKLESLHVESFMTTEAGRLARGTVEGHQDYIPDPYHTERCVVYTAARDCTVTEAMDCSFGCTMNVSCGTLCEVKPTR